MSIPSLLHELLLALLGHTGACISPLIEADDDHDDAPAAASATQPGQRRFVVAGLVLAEEVPFVTPAERDAINKLLQAGFAYVRILHFVQNIDAGATIRGAAGRPAATAAADAAEQQGGSHAGLRTTLASTALEQRALDAQQARHVYAAAGSMFSPPKPRRPRTDDEEEPEQQGSAFSGSTALVSLLEPLHPLLDTPAVQAAQPKAVGLYLRALGLGLEEVLSGYRALILKIEQDILAEAASDPSSAPAAAAADADTTQQPQQQQQHPRRIEYGLAKITLALRQYLVILPALQTVIATIVSSRSSAASAAAATAAHAATEASPASSPNPATPSAESDSSSAAAAASPSFHAHGIHGLRLLAFLSVSSQTGVPVLREVFGALLSKLRRVLHNQMQAWCFRGVLVDPFEEFFIQAEAAPPASAATAIGTAGASSGFGSFGCIGAGAGVRSPSKLHPLDWDRSYTLRLSQLPLDFLPELGGGGMATVHRVLFVGKAVLVLAGREAEEAQRRSKQGMKDAAATRSAQAIMWNAAATATNAPFTAQHSRFGSLSATPLNSNSNGGLRTPLSVRSAAATPRFDTQPGGHAANGTFARGFGAATASNTAAATPAAASSTVPSISLLEECQPLMSAFQALQSGSNAASGSGGGGPDFESLLHDLSRVVSRRLYLALLGPGCSLLTHLFHLKSFVLGGSGEFASAFIDLAESGVIGGADAGNGSSDLARYGGLLSRSLTPQVMARMDRDLNGSNGPVKQSLAYAGCNLEYDSDEAANDWGSGGGYSSREAAAALANYPVKHLTFHLSPDPSIAASATNAAAAVASVLSPSAAAAAAASGASPQTAWSLLRFEYRVSPPLDLIFLPGVMQQYNRLFRFFMQARRVQQSVQSMWQRSMRLRGGYTPRASAAVLPALLLRHSMSHFLDSLLSYLCVDVVGASWSKLVDAIGSTLEFEQVKRAHEQYVEHITTGAFMRERIISGAIHDLLDTCMLMVRSSAAATTTAASAQSHAQSQVLQPSSPVFLRLSGDFERQLCFLHSLLVAKTDFGSGGSGGFRVASLVARLDYNGHITRLSATLGLGRAQHTKLVPAAQGRGTVTSAAAIAQSMGRGSGPAAHGGNEVAASTAQLKRTTGAPPTVASSTVGGARLAATQSSFTPAHLAASSLTSQFAAGSTRPTTATRGGNGGPTSY